MSRRSIKRARSKMKRGRKVEILIVRKDKKGIPRLIGATKPVRRFGTFSPRKLR